jgi:ABC-type sugar transport system ATPase subunit
VKEPVLYINNANVTYSGRRKEVAPLSNLTLQVFPGEFIAILGESGSGKTTLLNFVAGFLRPVPRTNSLASQMLLWLQAGGHSVRVGGSVSICGEDATDLEPWRRDVGLVMQRFNLYPHMSVIENLQFPLKIRGVPSGVRHEKVKNVAERLGISSELEKRPHQLSGGQQQRVAIGKVLLRDPSVVLMDEPFSSLDWWWRNRLRRILSDEVLTNSEKGRCILFVTHDIEDAREADRVILLRREESSGNPNRTRLRYFPDLGEPAAPDKAWKGLISALEEDGFKPEGAER